MNLNIEKIMMPEKIAEERMVAFGHDLTSGDQLAIIIDEIRSRQNRIKYDILMIGGLLCEAKQIVGHGNFQKSVESHFDFSYSTAHNLMSVYIYCGGYPEAVETLKSTFLYEISKDSFSEDLRKYILENAKSLKKLDNKKVAEVSKRLTTKKIDIESEEVHSLVQYSHDNIYYGQYKSNLKECFEKVEKAKTSIEDLKKNMKWPELTGSSKTYLTSSEKKELKALISEIINAANDLMPLGTEIVKSLEPEFKVD
jgi:hypothetical protein